MIYFTFLIYSFVFGLIASTKGQWELINDCGNFKIIEFVNDQVGWVAGANTLFKTEDGGQTWNRMDENGTILAGSDSRYFRIEKLDFINEKFGWAIVHLDSKNYP